MFTMKAAKLQYSLVVFMVVFMVGIGVLGLKTGKNSDDALNIVYIGCVVPLKQLKVIADMYAVNIVDTSHKVRNGNLTWSKGLENIEEAVRTIKEKRTEYLEIVHVSNEQILIEVLTPRMKKADDAVAKLIDIMRRQDAAALARFTIADLYPVIDPVSETISELIEVRLKEAKVTHDRSTGEYYFTRSISNIALLAGVLLSGLGAFFLIWNLDRQLRAEPSKISQQTDNDAQEGRKDDTETVAAMKQIFAKINTIEEMAHRTRTNLLVLNATIKAVREGDNGRLLQ